MSQKRERDDEISRDGSGAVVSGALLVPTLANAGSTTRAELEKVTAEIRYNPRDLKTAEGAARFQRKSKRRSGMCRNGRQSVPSLYEDTKRCIAGARQSAAPQVQLALESAQHHSGAGAVRQPVHGGRAFHAQRLAMVRTLSV